MALSVYKRVAEKFPFLLPSIQSGILMGTGDFIAQKFLEKRNFQTLDRARLLRFSTIGFCIGVNITIYLLYLLRVPSLINILLLDNSILCGLSI